MSHRFAMDGCRLENRATITPFDKYEALVAKLRDAMLYHLHTHF